MKYTQEQLKHQAFLLLKKLYKEGLTVAEAEEYDRLVKKLAKYGSSRNNK